MILKDQEEVDRLVALDEKGLLMAPKETLEEFFRRVESQEKFEEYLSGEFRKRGVAVFCGMELREEDRLPEGLIRQCLQAIAECYKTVPSYLPVFVTKDVGFFWGGAAIGFRDTEGIIDKDAFFALVQLRMSFQHKKRFLIYDRDEILAHEACHIVRMAFEQEAYEEPLAYMLSKTGFRRYLGPILRNMRDFTIFAITFALFMVVQILGQTVVIPDFVWWASKMPFVLLVGYLGVINHGVYKRLRGAVRNLEDIFGENANAIVFRCSDGEIDEISGLSDSDKVRRRLQQKAEVDPRWQVMFRRFASS